MFPWFGKHKIFSRLLIVALAYFTFVFISSLSILPDLRDEIENTYKKEASDVSQCKVIPTGCGSFRVYSTKTTDENRIARLKKISNALSMFDAPGIGGINFLMFFLLKTGGSGGFCDFREMPKPELVLGKCVEAPFKESSSGDPYTKTHIILY